MQQHGGQAQAAADSTWEEPVAGLGPLPGMLLRLLVGAIVAGVCVGAVGVSASAIDEEGAAGSDSSNESTGPDDESASVSAEEQLAQTYAPVMLLVEQAEACGPGEPYVPSDV